MSLYGSMFSGVTGLTAQSRALGTISENITNINTVGFKAKTTHFSTLVAAGNAGSTPGVSGVLHNTAAQVDTQGILQTTENPTDIAIAGGGFFVVNSDVENGRAIGDTMFTRAGHFAVDKANHLANASGHFLMGWKLDKDGEFVDEANNPIVPDPTSEDDLLPVDLAEVTFTSEGTDNIEIKAAFPAQMTVGDTFQASSRIFDDLGGTHSADLNFTKTDHVQLAGSLPRLVDGATPAAPNNTFTISVSTPAASTIKDGAPIGVTALDLTFTFDGTDVDGVTTWNVVPSSADGDPTAETADAISVSFNSDNSLVDDTLQEIEIVWAESLNAKNSVFAFDFSELTPIADKSAATLDDLTSTVNANGAILKLAVASTNELDETVNGQDTFVQFDNNGLLVKPEAITVEFDWSNLDTFAPNTTVSLNIGTAGTATGLTVTGNDFVLNSTSQDGIAFGAFAGVTIDDDGFVIANFKNGTFLPVYRLPLADFSNPNGLSDESGNAFRATLESGDFFLNQAGVGGVGNIVPRALEQSTVDIAREFTNMIITQRAFSAASTAITTADEMLQELVQIKR